MAQVEITIRYMPLNGSRRVTQNVLTEVDTTLSDHRIGEMVGNNVRYAMQHALGFDTMAHHRVELVGGEVLSRVSFDGFYTVAEGSGLGGSKLHDYVKLTAHDRGRSETRAVRITNILRVVVLPH